MTRAVLSLGSNLGDRLAHLQSAVDGLGTVVRAVSPVFQTAPWGPVAQDDYLNAIVLVDDPAADGEEWLCRGQQLEQRAGRTRTVRFGPRTLDVDVITVDGARSDDSRLTLPHPRAHERAFVLVPWLAVSPDAVLPRRTERLVTGLRSGSVADGRAACEADRSADGRADRSADNTADRVADLVAGLPTPEKVGVRRRDDLTLTLRPGTRAPSSGRGSGRDVEAR